jgi:hypothetical protein
MLAENKRMYGESAQTGGLYKEDKHWYELAVGNLLCTVHHSAYLKIIKMNKMSLTGIVVNLRGEELSREEQHKQPDRSFCVGPPILYSVLIW